MVKTPIISIILPTFNEAENLPILIREIAKFLKGESLEIIVIDDDSPDKTWQIAEKLAKQYPLKVYRRINERGLTSALNLGLKKAKGKFIGWLDADLSHPPKFLPQLLKNLKNYDVVVASRYVEGGKDKRNNKKVVFFSWLTNKFAQFFLFSDFRDYTSGYLLAKKEVFKNLELEGDYGEYFIKLIFDLKKKGIGIKEIPYRNVDRKKGKSKTASNFLGFFKRGYKYLWTIFKLAFWRFC